MPGAEPGGAPYQAEEWPIAAAMLPFAATTASGVAVQDAPEEVWRASFAEVAAAGFADVDLTDSWVRPGDLSPERLQRLGAVVAEAGLRAPAISAIRRSVIDPETGDENLAYSHRTIDAAAELGCGIVSFGLHRPLTDRQRAALWFWTVDGPKDADDPETWSLAVTRLRELADHASSVGVALTLEMYEDTLIGTADGAVRLVEDVGRDVIGLNPDLGNLYRLHRPVEPFLDALAKCLPYTNYWHVKSYYRDEDASTGAIWSVPAPMESGTMNYRRAIKLALASGYTAPFCVEHYGGDGLSVSARNRDYLRGLLAFELGPSASREVL